MCVFISPISIPELKVPNSNNRSAGLVLFSRHWKTVAVGPIPIVQLKHCGVSTHFYTTKPLFISHIYIQQVKNNWYSSVQPLLNVIVVGPFQIWAPHCYHCHICVLLGESVDIYSLAFFSTGFPAAMNCGPTIIEYRHSFGPHYCPWIQTCMIWNVRCVMRHRWRTLLPYSVEPVDIGADYFVAHCTIDGSCSYWFNGPCRDPLHPKPNCGAYLPSSFFR